MHAEIDYCGNTSAPLTGALLIYGNGEFLMQCRADGDELCDARAITDAELMELINSIKPVQRRWIEPPLLLDSGQELIWWTPAQQRTLYFERARTPGLPAASAALALATKHARPLGAQQLQAPDLEQQALSRTVL
jgi:hypothetical protein